MAASMSRAAFARTMGVNKSQVTRWADAGMPVLADGAVDPEEAAPWVHANVDPRLRLHHARQVEQRRESIAKRNLVHPPGTAHLTNDADRAMVTMLPQLAYRLPAAMIACADECGVPLPAAYALHKVARMAAVMELLNLLDAVDVQPPPGHDDWQGASIIDVDAFSQVNWPALAEQAGAATDLDGWEAEARQRLMPAG